MLESFGVKQKIVFSLYQHVECLQGLRRLRWCSKVRIKRRDRLLVTLQQGTIQRWNKREKLYVDTLKRCWPSALQSRNRLKLRPTQSCRKKRRKMRYINKPDSSNLAHQNFQSESILQAQIHPLRPTQLFWKMTCKKTRTKTRKKKCINKPDPSSLAHQNFESESIIQAQIHPDKDPGLHQSVSQTSSSDYLSTVQTIVQPLSETPYLGTPEVTSPLKPPVLKASKAKKTSHQSRILKSNMRGVLPRANNPRRLFRYNIQFWWWVLTKWGHRTWRKARCLLWLSMFKAKRYLKTRFCPPRTNSQVLNETGDVQGSQPTRSPSIPKGTCGPEGGCDWIEAGEDNPAEGASDQKVCPSLVVLDPTPSPHLDQGSTTTEAWGITATQAKETNEAVPSQSQQPAVNTSSEAIKRVIHRYLDNFLEKYGSFIPMSLCVLMEHLNKELNTDLSKRRSFISQEVEKHQSVLARRPMPLFRLVLNKHSLTLEDLFTLDDHNWLNDQVMNMYGELIMKSAHQKVHFLNSFFHRQLVTKGYEGVRRWTKKVDLFSKTLLLVPIHLDIHWCLVTANTASKRIDLYDSQGVTFKKAAQNILKYIKMEAKEKQQTAFQSGWKVFVNEKIPQQTNENDCGVFVLEYCRCLALGKPLHFSQTDMSRVRKRMYRELCECQLNT